MRFLQDAKRFLLSNRAIIEQAPLQTYGTALAFSPQKSEIKMQHWPNRLPYIKNITGIRDNWDLCLQTLEGHREGVQAVTFSPDGQTLASASDDRTIRLWDTATGIENQILEGHRYAIQAVTFSPDGQTLASVSGDQTIFINKEWVIQNGQKILWLPPDYRPTCTAVYENKLVLGHSSGQVTFLEISHYFPDSG
jgi:WD40 repeat protein